MQVTSFAEIETEFIARAHRAVWCSFATSDTRNRLRTRVMHPVWESDTGWIFTYRHSLKEKHLAHNPYVSLAYIADPLKPVYVDCRAAWDDELNSKQRLWELLRSLPLPLGYDCSLIFAAPDHPDVGLLKLTPWRVELYDLMNQENRRTWLRPVA